MSQTKHTPGPWEWQGYDLVGSDGFTIASVDFFGSADEADANGRLIKAAPAMLEALRSVAAYLDKEDSPALTAEVLAAIAAAEGK